MPYSDPAFDDILCQWLKRTVPTNKLLLDVGAGAGKFAKILPEYTFDAVEPFKPYHEQFQLQALYRNLYTKTIQQFLMEHDVCGYACVILGDILEHLTIEHAYTVLQTLFDADVHILVKVPYLYPQKGSEENSMEEHLQPELTHKLMQERYPQLRVLVMNDSFGVYIRKDAL